MRSAGLIVCVLSLLVAGDAFGASKSKKSKNKADTGVQETGIEAFDSVFARVGEIDAQLTSTETELRTVFLRHTSPHRPFASSSAITAMIYARLDRAGIPRAIAMFIIRR